MRISNVPGSQKVSRRFCGDPEWFDDVMRARQGCSYKGEFRRKTGLSGRVGQARGQD
jgi:hypothetical protein